MDVADFWNVVEYCKKWNDRTFLIQSKNPVYFLKFQELRIPDNVILGTTIETNRDGWICDPVTAYPTPMLCKYDLISKAPSPAHRFEAMLRIPSKIFLTIEPILNFDMDIFMKWIKILSPVFCYIGYDSHPEKNKLPEPPLSKTTELIRMLRELGVEVREKLLRKAWWEK